MEVQSSWAANSIEPHPVKAMATTETRMAKGRNVVEFIPQVYWIPDSKLRESEYLWNGSQVSNNVWEQYCNYKDKYIRRS